MPGRHEKQEIVFVKHGAPNHILAPILHIQPQSLYMRGYGRM